MISDTHGLLRPEVVARLEGSDLVIHAGDVGDPAILDRLRAIAPVVAVRGNVDRGGWAEALPMTEVVEAGEHLLYLLHIREELDLDPAAAGMSMVITGHTHKPLVETKKGVVYLNPGSVGPRRFSLPVSMARLTVQDSRLDHELLKLDV